MSESTPCDVIDIWTLVAFGWVRMQSEPYCIIIPPELIKIIIYFSIIELPTLFNWLQDGGATFSKLNYFINRKNTYTGCCTIRTKNKIKREEGIFCIPLDFIMTSDIAKESEIGEKIIESNVELRSKHSFLACYLLQEREKGPLSKWNVYISTLPKIFDNIPFNFTLQEKAELTGSMTLNKIHQRYQSLNAEYMAICDAVPEFGRFSLDQFIWARLVVITRLFGLVIDDVKTDGLVPVADFLRHKRPRMTKWTFSQKQRGFVMTALQDIEQDAEVFVSFGRKCNSRFFVNYGFIVENNPDNEALITLQLDRDDEKFAMKAGRLGFEIKEIWDKDTEVKVNLRKNFQIGMQQKDKKVREAFSFLRICHAQGDEFYMITYAHHLSSDNIPPLSIENELKVLKALSEAARTSLDEFKTSLEFDDKLLMNEKEYPLYSNKRNIVVMRKGEKEVLTFYIELEQICSALFEMSYKELKMKMKEDVEFKEMIYQKDGEGNDCALLQYIQLIVLPLLERGEKSM